MEICELCGCPSDKCQCGNDINVYWNEEHRKDCDCQQCIELKGGSE